jgi:hypothetical protein
MKKNILRLGYCFVLMLMLSACFRQSQPEPKLPPATQRGANTFGCKVNGKVWVATRKDAGFGASAVSIEIYTLDGLTSIDIGANNYPFAEAEGIDLNFVSKKLVVGEYFGKTTIDSITTAARIVDLIPRQGLINYNLRTDLPASLKITYIDTVRRIISGEFYFTAGGTNSQLYEITEGRFDLTYPGISNLK